MAEKQVPHAPEAEVSVLGGMLQDPEGCAKALDILEGSMFFREAHRLLFESMLRLFGRSEPIEPITVREELASRDELEAIGGHYYLGELLDAVPTAANIEYHAGIVKDRALRRRLCEAGTEIVRLGMEADGRPATEVLDAAAGLIYKASAGESKGPVHISKAITPAFTLIEKAEASKGGVTGVPTGLYDLDEMTGGWQKGDLIVLAARPSMGKTALATGFLIAAAIENGIPAELFSLEMTLEQVVHRCLCWGSGVDLGCLVRGRLTDYDYPKLATAAGMLDKAPVWIDASSQLTVTQLRARARRLKTEQPNLGLIIVDYLQLMTADAENRTQEVSKISAGLKSIAKDLGLPVIALSQLSRALEGREDKRPRLSDLRESGSIEQDADVVLFLWRPEKYFGAVDKKGNDIRGKAELIIGKQRNGPTEPSVNLYFRASCAKFESAAKTSLSVA